MDQQILLTVSEFQSTDKKTVRILIQNSSNRSTSICHALPAEYQAVLRGHIIWSMESLAGTCLIDIMASKAKMQGQLIAFVNKQITQ